MYKTIKILFVTILAGFAYRCSSPVANGGATETVNALVMVQDSSIHVTLQSQSDDTIQADIVLIQTNYNPVLGEGIIDSAYITGTSITTQFTQNSGSYNVVIHERTHDKLLFVSSLATGAGASQKIADTLSMGSILSGTVTLTQSFDTAQSRCYVYLSGTPFLCPLATDNTFMLKNIPGGTYTVTATITNTEKSNATYFERNVSQEVTLARDSALIDMALYFSN